MASDENERPEAVSIDQIKFFPFVLRSEFHYSNWDFASGRGGNRSIDRYLGAEDVAVDDEEAPDIGTEAIRWRAGGERSFVSAPATEEN